MNKDKFQGVLKTLSREYGRFKDIVIFIALLLLFSIIGYFWKLSGYQLFGVSVLDPAYAFLIRIVLFASGGILQHIFMLDVSLQVETSRIYLSRDVYVFLYHGCSGLKEMAMFIFIMVFFPGPWRSKLWFIPASLLFIFSVVILRVVMLVLIFNYHPSYYGLFHNFLLNYIFFGIFFILWLIWVKYFYMKKRRPGKPEPS
jgi:exosortase/archaeosortase family protein